MVYLASPYTHPNKEVEAARFVRVCIVAAKLMNQGMVVFCPIAHGHPIAMAGQLPTTAEYWMRFMGEFVCKSERVLVICLPGWDTSTGIEHELSIAASQGIPVQYLNPETMEIANEPNFSKTPDLE